jgi:hypothetical protein
LDPDECVSIGGLAAQAVRIKLDRDARWRKAVMMKWFEEHAVRIQLLLSHVTLGKMENKGSERAINETQGLFIFL